MFRPPPTRPARAPPDMQLARLPDPDQVGAMIVRGTTHFAKKNPIITGSYFLGLVILLFFTTGTELTHKQASQYQRIMNSVDLHAEYNASNDYWVARNAYEATRGWFWSCDSLCLRNKKRMEAAERTLKAIREESAARVREAKKVAGIFSEVGVGEVKDSFWEFIYRGKEFAKRQSAWDAVFIGIRSMTRGRDETWIEFGLKVLLQVLLNFSMGLIMAFLFFVFGLWTIVRSYQPNPIVAVLFFVGAVLAAGSFVVSYLLGLYGAAATGVYALAKVTESVARAQLEGQQGRRRMEYAGQRPHYD